MRLPSGSAESKSRSPLTMDSKFRRLVYELPKEIAAQRTVIVVTRGLWMAEQRGKAARPRTKRTGSRK